MSLFLSWLQKPTNTSSIDSPSTPFRDREVYRSSPEPTRSSPSHLSRPHDITSSPNTPPRVPSNYAVLLQRSTSLQAYLQTLLDAQAEGLVSGLDHSSPHTSRSATPSTSRSARSTAYHPPVTPVRQPSDRPLGLRAARRGIWETMRELTSVHEEESTLLASLVQEQEDNCGRVRAWQTKKEGLEREIRTIWEQDDAARTQILREEEAGLSQQINALEAQLAELRARHRRVHDQLAGAENAVQSKLSSYRASLALVDDQVSLFLRNVHKSPAASIGPSSGSSPGSARGMSSSELLQLPPKRRTLGMALEYFENQGSSLRESMHRVQQERDALIEGSRLWKAVVGEVSSFERHLRSEMQNMAQMSNGIKTDMTASGMPNTNLRKTLIRMNRIIRDLEENVAMAQERGWNLLVCAIGAELEAFQQGREMLRSLLGNDPSQPSDPADAATAEYAPGLHASTDALQDHVKEHDHVDDVGSNNEHREDEVDQSAHHEGSSSDGSPVIRRGVFASMGRRATSEDDEPDPDLLISQQDSDEED